MSQSIPRMTAALSSGTTQQQTICAFLETNKILSLANLALSTLKFFPNITQIGSTLMFVVFTTCENAALIKLCVMTEPIKSMLQLYVKPLQVIPKA